MPKARHRDFKIIIRINNFLIELQFVIESFYKITKETKDHEQYAILREVKKLDIPDENRERTTQITCYKKRVGLVKAVFPSGRKKFGTGMIISNANQKFTVLTSASILVDHKK